MIRASAESSTVPTIRRIRADEGFMLREIRLCALRDAPSAFGSTVRQTLARPDDFWHRRAERNAAGEDSVLYIAEEDGRRIGLAGGLTGLEGQTAGVELVSMWVHPEHRGRGIGKLLVERVIEWAMDRGARSIVLWVTQNNAEATRLYRRMGFEPTGETQPQREEDEHPLLEQRMLRYL